MEIFKSILLFVCLILSILFVIALINTYIEGIMNKVDTDTKGLILHGIAPMIYWSCFYCISL